MKYTTPEKVGVSSENIQKYIEILEKTKLATHNIIMARGDEIFYEGYWKPFNKDFLHRMYSVSKSFVSIAIGFLEQDGKISLDDKIGKYFPDEIKNQHDENMLNQTIRDMLMMCTAKPVRNWFEAKPDDRVRFYFENDNEQTRPSGTIFQYDSEGSFVLGALVERITKMPFMEYLREKLFRKIGVSEEAYCLKCPGGHSWGDSAVICRPTDLLKVIRFIMNKGMVDGEQVLNEKYLTEATKYQVFNDYQNENDFNTQGYGYQIWRSYDNSYFFNGMGSQYAVGIPDKDMIFIYNADNQGKDNVRKVIFDAFYELIVNQAKDEPLAANEQAEKALREKTDRLKLISVKGAKTTDFAKKINGVTYIMDKNPMGISKFRLTFSDNTGSFEYTNAQGNKTIKFGMCENSFGKFPQEGYADEVGTIETKDFYYDCAASAAWVEEKKLYINVQIIDKYFGNFGITIGFRDDLCGIFMNKIAEDFLKEYEGFAGGKRLC